MTSVGNAYPCMVHLSYIGAIYLSLEYLFGETRIVRESDYSPVTVLCMQKKARVSQDIEC